MFNSGRRHRLITVPVISLVLVVAVLGGHPVFTLAIFPLLAAMPWILNAAHAGTYEAIDHALFAVRLVGSVAIAWGLIVLAYAPPAGFIQIGACIAVLIAAGRGFSEERLAVVVMLGGLLLSFAAALLMWLGTAYLLMVPAGIAMFIGGTWWLADAARQSVTLEPELPFAIASIA
ncbi:hypothetical protein BH11MYX3_BH11MYX3_26230 [soil metagenome]